MPDLEETPPSIRTLIEEARHGQRSSIDHLARLLLPRVQQILEAQMTGASRRWIEPGDVAQVVLTEALARLDQLDPGADEHDLLRWLRPRMKHRMIDFLRQFARENGESALPELDRPASEVTGPVTRRDTALWIRELVARLPRKYAEVVHLCAFEGRSCREAASLLELPTTTVRMRYEAARRALNRRLASALDG